MTKAKLTSEHVCIFRTVGPNNDINYFESIDQLTAYLVKSDRMPSDGILQGRDYEKVKYNLISKAQFTLEVLIKTMLSESSTEFVDLREIAGRLVDDGYSPVLVETAIKPYKNLGER